MTDRSTLISSYEAALDWWRDAGVDCDYADDVTTWLAPPETEEAAAAPVKPPPQVQQTTALDRALAPSQGGAIGGEREDWSADLAAFREWWLSELSLDESRASERIAPRGPAKASLMVLVGVPDEGDKDTLLSGLQGDVLRAFLRAAAVDESAVYVASALPRRVAMPDWADLAGRGLAEVTRHHIGVAGADRVLVFGRSIAPLAADSGQSDRVGDIPLLVAPSLENLSRSAARKRRFWKNWLEWTS